MLPHNARRGQQGFQTDYLRRVLKYPQMDIDYTFWQILYLILDPRRVYKNTTYHKQTKNQWARDDPAFSVVLIFFIAVSVVAYSIALPVDSLWGFTKLFIGAICIDFLLVGCVVSSVCFFLCNKYLRSNLLPHGVEQRVEWLYAWDVHCNSFLPVVLVLHGVQYFLLPIVLAKGLFPILVGNSLYVLAFSYYHYITFLGYSALPFLHEPRWFLYPISLVIITGILSVMLGFNAAQFTLSFYFSSSALPAAASTVTTAPAAAAAASAAATAAVVAATAAASAVAPAPSADSEEAESAEEASSAESDSAEASSEAS